jgi:hypothetical protein
MITLDFTNPALALRLGAGQFHRTVRAEHAAIPRFRLQQYAATFALVEILARGHGHVFDLRMRTGRTRDH